VTNQLTVTIVALFMGAVALASLLIAGYLVHSGITETALIITVSTPGATALGFLGGMVKSSDVRSTAAPLTADELERLRAELELRRAAPITTTTTITTPAPGSSEHPPIAPDTATS
jgi:hypothetical protein